MTELWLWIFDLWRHFILRFILFLIRYNIFTTEGHPRDGFSFLSFAINIQQLALKEDTEKKTEFVFELKMYISSVKVQAEMLKCVSFCLVELIMQIDAIYS